jgi:hypothetical protein
MTTSLPLEDDEVADRTSRREVRRGWLVLLLAVLLACALFGLSIWRVLWPALREAWARAQGG